MTQSRAAGTRVSHRAKRTFIPIAFAVLCVAPFSLGAQAVEPVDNALVAKIREEAFNRSQVMNTVSYLTDVSGPRLTGSPNARKAADWTMAEMKKWGLTNPRLESWGPFGRGWTNDKFYAQVTAPVPFPVIGYPQAWTPGTNGLVKSEVIYVKINEESDFAKYKGKLKGKIVMLSPMREVAASFTALGSRMTDEQLEKLAQAPLPAATAAGRGGRGGAPTAPLNPADSARRAQQQQLAAITARRQAFILDEGVAAILEPGRGDGGTVFTNNGQSRDPKTPYKIPLVAMAIEHYGRIFRVVEKGIPVQMELDIKNTFYDSDLNSFNIIAEIPGTDPALKDEVVMLGAHFDSWHAGTGATDNAAGSAIMMEAMRILKAVGANPKRTIRIGLWTGEEQGLLGSRAYVKEHYGTRDSVKAEAEKFSVYLNLDNGTGAIRGVYQQGNPNAAPVFKEWLKPFADKGIKTLAAGNTGGTDHQSFDGIGLPGFQFIQDPVEYNTRTHHSSMDTYERVQAEDMKLNSAVLAAFAIQAANSPTLFPRKPVIKVVP